MEKFNELYGTIVTGAQLKSLGLNFVKITNIEMKHYDFQYVIGKNTDIYDLSQNPCSQGGLYFCPADEMVRFLDHGDGYHEVTFADDEPIYVEEYKCKAKTIILSEKKLFVDLSIDVARSLIEENGSAISQLSDEVRNNEELFILSLYKSHGYTITLINNSIEIEKYKKFCLIALSLGHVTLDYYIVSRAKDYTEITLVYKIVRNTVKKVAKKYFNLFYKNKDIKFFSIYGYDNLTSLEVVDYSTSYKPKNNKQKINDFLADMHMGSGRVKK